MSDSTSTKCLKKMTATMRWRGLIGRKDDLRTSICKRPTQLCLTSRNRIDWMRLLPGSVGRKCSWIGWQMVYSKIWTKLKCEMTKLCRDTSVIVKWNYAAMRKRKQDKRNVIWIKWRLRLQSKKMKRKRGRWTISLTSMSKLSCGRRSGIFGRRKMTASSKK